MIIAIDGPAASGKGTLARRLAAHFGLPHLDTGLLYRATARALLDAGLRASTTSRRRCAPPAAVALLDFDEDRLRGPRNGRGGLGRSRAIPQVRAALIDMQRAFAARPQGAGARRPRHRHGHRPQADVKIFVTASPEARAQRRALELRGRGETVDYAAILEDIRKRDKRDTERAEAPLKPAADAHLLDTDAI